MEKLIAGVRAEPCLWNPVHSDYREVIEREEAWQRVVTHCNNKSIPDGELSYILMLLFNRLQ